MSERIFGEIPGTFEGQLFNNRNELSISLVHRPTQAGISGSQNEGADSIVLSGGYEDDADYGETIIYTGHGGKEDGSTKQVTNQELIRQNLALAISCQQGLPVRVIRGVDRNSQFSPESGYRYDGLYRVEDYWKETGRSGFKIWRFRLSKISKELTENYIIQDPDNTLLDDEKKYDKPNRLNVSISRIIRDTELSKRIKEIYKYKCQVCGLSILTNSGPYAEAAHIKPLGAPHNGPDILANLICLCPNHHVKFDFGGFSILDNLELVGEPGKLLVEPSHKINIEFIQYHRTHFYEDK
jgi:putative restriction endonuclease